MTVLPYNHHTFSPILQVAAGIIKVAQIFCCTFMALLKKILLQWQLLFYFGNSWQNECALAHYWHTFVLPNNEISVWSWERICAHDQSGPLCQLSMHCSSDLLMLEQSDFTFCWVVMWQNRSKRLWTSERQTVWQWDHDSRLQTVLSSSFSTFSDFLSLVFNTNSHIEMLVWLSSVLRALTRSLYSVHCYLFPVYS